MSGIYILLRYNKLSGYIRYDFFKAELLKTGHFDDNIYVHTTASFAAVRSFCSRT